MARVAAETHQPDPAGVEACAEGHRRYRALFDALAGSFRELA